MSTTKTSDERKTHKTEPNKVQKGDLMSFTYYVKVKSTDLSRNEMMVEDLINGGQEIQVRGRELIENSYSADQYVEEEKVSMTKCAEILISSPNRPLTVCFEKKDGTERVLRGRFIKHEALLGRSMVEDLDVKKTDKEDGLRQVDHRTIKWLVVDGVRYTVGKK
jgi:hypothetical protein